MGVCQSTKNANKNQYYNSKGLNSPKGKPQKNSLNNIKSQSDYEYYASRIREKRAGDQ